MLLFTQAPLSVGGSEIPPGAFSLYLMQEKQIQTLVISKNVTPGSDYDEKQDLARVQMQTGKIGTAVKQVEVLFAHVAPQQCNLRVYEGNTGAWAEFKEAKQNR